MTPVYLHTIIRSKELYLIINEKLLSDEISITIVFGFLKSHILLTDHNDNRNPT